VFSTSAGEAPFEEQPFPIDKVGLLFFSMRFTVVSVKNRPDTVWGQVVSHPRTVNFDKGGRTKVIGSQ